jgi:hypothetical protein
MFVNKQTNKNYMLVNLLLSSYIHYDYMWIIAVIIIIDRKMYPEEMVDSP